MDKFIIYLVFTGGLLTVLGLSGIAGEDGLWLTLIGVGCLVTIVVLTLLFKIIQKYAQKKENEQALAEQTETEREQKWLAKLEGLQKPYRMGLEEERRHREGVEAMRQLGVIVEASVYQEEEKDWAIHGGIAQGVAGPLAGVAVAAKTMQENAEIRERNAAQRQWGAQQNQSFQHLANEAERNKPRTLSLAQLEEQYEANLSWSPATLLSKFRFTDTKAEVDPATGAVTVSTFWCQGGIFICIDGSLRAKLYAPNGKCVGCAYLVFPKEGSEKRSGKLTGICARPKAPGPYKVVIEPYDLWELAAKGRAWESDDDLLDQEHRELVKQSEEKFLAELQ